MWVLAVKASTRETYDYIWLYDSQHRPMGLGRVKLRKSKPAIVVPNVRRCGHLAYVYSMGHGVIFTRGRNSLILDEGCSLEIALPEIEYN